MPDAAQSGNSGPQVTPIKPDPSIMGILNRILVMNQTIVESLCRPLIVTTNAVEGELKRLSDDLDELRSHVPMPVTR